MHSEREERATLRNQLGALITLGELRLSAEARSSSLCWLISPIVRTKILLQTNAVSSTDKSLGNIINIEKNHCIIFIPTNSLLEAHASYFLVSFSSILSRVDLF